MAEPGKDQKGGGNPGKTVQEYILDRFKDAEDPQAEQAKSYPEALRKLDETLAERNRLKQGQDTYNALMGEKEETIEDLKRQLAVRPPGATGFGLRKAVMGLPSSSSSI